MTSAIDKIKARHADLGAASEAFARAGGDPGKMVVSAAETPASAPEPVTIPTTPTPAPVISAPTPKPPAPNAAPSPSPNRGGRKSHIGAGEPITMKLAFAQIDGLNELRLEAQVRGRHRLEVADVIRLAVDELLARPRSEQLKAVERAASRR